MANDQCRIEIPQAAGKSDAAGSNHGAEQADTAAQAQLGCYDQLVKDASQAYPGDKLMQHAAVEDKMGWDNLTSNDRKLLEANREFIDMPPLQALAVKEAEYKYFKQGEPLTPAEQGGLGAQRQVNDQRKEDKETADRVEGAMPMAKVEFPHDQALQTLAAKEIVQHQSGRLILDSKDYAALDAARRYPDNAEMRDLMAREQLSRAGGGPPLTPAERARFEGGKYRPEAERFYPDDPEAQALAIKSAVSDIPGQPKLTPEENAKLNGAGLFHGDLETRKLYEAQALQNLPGHEPLNDAQKDQLAKATATREFPQDQKLQGIAYKEQLWLSEVSGAQGLNREDYQALSNARLSRLRNIIDVM